MGWAPSTGGSGRFSGILKPQSPPPPPLNLPVSLTAGCSAADSPFGCHSFDGGHRRASRALRPYGLRAETGSPRWSEASKESWRQARRSVRGPHGRCARGRSGGRLRPYSIPGPNCSTQVSHCGTGCERNAARPAVRHKKFFCSFLKRSAISQHHSSGPN